MASSHTNGYLRRILRVDPTAETIAAEWLEAPAFKSLGRPLESGQVRQENQMATCFHL